MIFIYEICNIGNYIFKDFYKEVGGWERGRSVLGWKKYVWENEMWLKISIYISNYYFSFWLILFEECYFYIF